MPLRQNKIYGSDYDKKINEIKRIKKHDFNFKAITFLLKEYLSIAESNYQLTLFPL
jgi:hypothetical protein